jgi:hypothetical protein
MTREQLKEIFGATSEEKLTAIYNSGARLEDVIEAKAIVDGKADIAGLGEREIRGSVRDVLVILTSD